MDSNFVHTTVTFFFFLLFPITFCRILRHLFWSRNDRKVNLKDYGKIIFLPSPLLSPLLSSPLLAALGSARWRIRECRNLLPLSDKSSISGEAGGGLRALRLLERHTPGAEAPVSGPGSSQPLPTSGESPPGAGSSARPRGGGAPPLAAFPGIATPLWT